MDRISREARSAVMSRIRGRGTRIELDFARELRRSGLQFRRHVAMLGRPDIIFPEAGVVVFLDSCFWHRCPCHFRAPQSRQDYWGPKIAQNVRRDRLVRSAYRRAGWKVLRFWEHSIASSLPTCIRKTREAVRSRRPGTVQPPTKRRVLTNCVRF